MWTKLNGSVIRKGQRRNGAALFNTEPLKNFDVDIEERLRVLGSVFSYAVHYLLHVKSRT